MQSKPEYLKHFEKSGELKSADGRSIDIWELAVPAGDHCFSEWAKHFRQHYCLDTKIDELRDGTGLSRSDYLLQLVFPDKTNSPGPSIRSGDFAELLIADYVEYVLGFWVPRGKYAEKESRNESAKGVDILGFKITTSEKNSPTDTLLTFEVKARLTGDAYKGSLQTAVDDSAKDYLRSAYTLNATKRRLIAAGNQDKADVVKRFQNRSDQPYILASGAAAVLSDASYDETGLQQTTTANHNNAATLQLMVVHGSDLMALVHALYERAANEA